MAWCAGCVVIIERGEAATLTFGLARREWVRRSDTLAYGHPAIGVASLLWGLGEACVDAGTVTKSAERANTLETPTTPPLRLSAKPAPLADPVP